jgi:hypothetical protein
VDHLPLIVIEVVLVFGGAMAFAWWQFRDLRREREKRASRDTRQKPVKREPVAPAAAEQRDEA